MSVLAFVGCHHNAWVAERSLHAFLHITRNTGATIVAPVQMLRAFNLFLGGLNETKWNRKWRSEGSKRCIAEWDKVLLPGKRAVFHSFLTVLSPSVPIFQMIHLAFRHERESRFSLSLLICLLSLQPKTIPENHQILLESSKH